jgi:peptide/nickel transport system permease protein
MIAYIFRRLGCAALSIWIISVVAFAIIHLPAGGARPEQAPFALRISRVYGVTGPFHERYGKWMWTLLHGDLGRSYMFFETNSPTERTVREVTGDRLWLTVALAGFTILVTWTMAVPIRIYSAVRHHSIGDYVFTTLGFTGLAVPDFLLGLVLMYVAFAYLGQSVGGLFSFGYQFDDTWSWAKGWDLFKHLWIPAAVLGTSGTASLIRILRNNLLDELGKPYLVTARAKGVPALRAILKYPVRVAVNPLVSTVGYLVPSLISGSVIVSVVLSLPTLGPVLLRGIIQEDVFLAGFIILMLGVLMVMGTLLSDILLAVVDLRIRFTGR